MMSLLLRPFLNWPVALLLVWTMACFYAGDRYRSAIWLGNQAELEQAAVAHLQAEQARGDALWAGLLVQQAQIDQLKEEAHRAITTQTTGRACLDGPALRVLSRAPGVTIMPAPTSWTTAAHGATASAADDAGADDYASDTQIAHWAIDAAGQYETCRLRLDALIDWHTQPLSTP